MLDHFFRRIQQQRFFFHTIQPLPHKTTLKWRLFPKHLFMLTQYGPHSILKIPSIGLDLYRQQPLMGKNKFCQKVIDKPISEQGAIDCMVALFAVAVQKGAEVLGVDGQAGVEL
jgi:hypothetical protein